MNEKQYEHVFSIGFIIQSDEEDFYAISDEELRSTIMQRIDEILSYHHINEACLLDTTWTRLEKGDE